jgi:Leucine-rich repeat (LRR) protein
MSDVYNGTRLQFLQQPDLSAYTNLRTVLLNSNEILVVYSELLPPNVAHINLARNCISSDGLPPFWPESLETLNLDENPFTTTYEVGQWPQRLRELSLDDTPLTETPKSLPQSLELLSMSYCHLITLGPLPPTLKKIRAFYNSLRSLAPLPSAATWVHLGRNSLTSYATFRHPLPQGLRYLNLEYNTLTTLPKNLPDTLEQLVLNNNAITELPKTLPMSLQMLVLNNNRIRVFNPTWRHGQRTLQLHIRNNFLTTNLSPLVTEGRLSVVYQTENWNQDIHTTSTHIIQRSYKRYKMRKQIRCWARVHTLREELIATAMLPELVTRYNHVESLHSFR